MCAFLVCGIHSLTHVPVEFYKRAIAAHCRMVLFPLDYEDTTDREEAVHSSLSIQHKIKSSKRRNFELYREEVHAMRMADILLTHIGLAPMDRHPFSQKPGYARYALLDTYLLAGGGDGDSCFYPGADVDLSPVYNSLTAVMRREDP